METTSKNLISLVCILNTRFTANLIIVSCKILLTFGSVKQFLWCSHFNNTSLAVLAQTPFFVNILQKKKHQHIVKTLDLQSFSLDISPSPLTFRKKIHIIYRTSTNVYIIITRDVADARPARSRH